MGKEDLNIAVICSSNQNRSMEAHALLNKRGFTVRSFGSGQCVKLPGTAADKPNIYEFNTSYDDIYKDLVRKDKDLYTQNGLLHMVDRNKRIKAQPERWQDSVEHFDLIICCEERVFEQVMEDLTTREKIHNEPSHILNIDIADNHNDATLGALIICDIVQAISEVDDVDSEIDQVIHHFERKCQIQLLHSVEFV